MLYLSFRDSVISDEEAQQLMCPLENEVQQSSTKVETEKQKTLERMNSFHVGPVKLPHPVKMPNGRVSNSRASSEDYTKNTATNHPKHVRLFLHLRKKSTSPGVKIQIPTVDYILNARLLINAQY